MSKRSTNKLPVRGDISMLSLEDKCWFCCVFLEVSVRIATKAEEKQAVLRNTPQTPEAHQNPKLNQEPPESVDTTLRTSNTNAGSPRGPDKRAKKTLPLLPKRRPTLLEMVSVSTETMPAAPEQLCASGSLPCRKLEQPVSWSKGLK